MNERTMTIGELAVKIKSADLAAQVIDTAIASDFEVLVKYSYQPGEAASFEDDGLPVEVEIKSIRATANIHFAGDKTDTIIRRGEDILALFSGAQVTALEDQILAAIEADNTNHNREKDSMTNAAQNEVVITESQAIQAAPQRPVTASDLLLHALNSGADLDRLERLMALKERHEADEARKAYVSDMAAFKMAPPEIKKDKEVGFTNREGVFVGYKHATLGNVTGVIVEGLAKHGFSHRWDTEQQGTNVTVTCVLTHRMGHSERTTLTAPKDDSGKKNNIQQMASTITYLQRYTLLAATGLATHDQHDDDGASAELAELAEGMPAPGSRTPAKPPINAKQLAGAIQAIKDGSYTYEDMTGYYALTPEQDEAARLELGMEAAA